nr:MAG TPA: hypothetical protein [Caudoviricetes sp.]
MHFLNFGIDIALNFKFFQVLPSDSPGCLLAIPSIDRCLCAIP